MITKSDTDKPDPYFPWPYAYIPEARVVLKDTIYHSQRAIALGIEYAQEVLSMRDNSFGRSTRSNRTAAEMLERDIEHMKKCLEKLKQPDRQYHQPELDVFKNNQE
jgi:hypothetical protein